MFCYHFFNWKFISEVT